MGRTGLGPTSVRSASGLRSWTKSALPYKRENFVVTRPPSSAPLRLLWCSPPSPPLHHPHLSFLHLHLHTTRLRLRHLPLIVLSLKRKNFFLLPPCAIKEKKEEKEKEEKKKKEKEEGEEEGENKNVEG